MTDVAVGSGGDNDGGIGRGAVWLLHMNTDGTVQSEIKLSDTQGGFGGVLDDGDLFGTTVCPIGDLDGDGIIDLGIGARGDSDGGLPGSNRGAVWIVFLGEGGTVKNQQKINDMSGGFGGALEDLDYFGTAVLPLGDLDGDQVIDIAVGARGGDSATGPDNHMGGAVWILFMNSDGTVKSHLEIGSNQGGLTETLDQGDQFGNSLANLGDLDGDGNVDIAVGLKRDDESGAGNNDKGSVFILFLNADGTVKNHTKITEGVGGFTGLLTVSAFFGTTLSSVGDLDGDGVVDLAVGAKGDSDGGSKLGSTYILFLNPDGTVKAHQKISATTGGFTGPLETQDFFGSGMGSLGDLDGDGVTDIAVGARLDDDGAINAGAFYVLFLNGRDDGIISGASAVLKPGCGINLGIFSHDTMPVLGSTWESRIETDAVPGASETWVVGYEKGDLGTVIPQGELLVDLTSLHVLHSVSVPIDDVSQHSIQIPNCTELIGMRFTTQAVIMGDSISLTNAIELTLGQ